MDKRKINSLVKRKIQQIKISDLKDLHSTSTLLSSISLHTKIQISSYLRDLMDVKDLKKLLNYLSKSTSLCFFVVSKDHLFFSGTDDISELTTYNKLNLFRFSLKDFQIKKIQKAMVEAGNEPVEGELSTRIDSYMVDNSLLIAGKIPSSNLYLGVLGSEYSEFPNSIPLLEFLLSQEAFSERIARIFN